MCQPEYAKPHEPCHQGTPEVMADVPTEADILHLQTIANAVGAVMRYVERGNGEIAQSEGLILLDNDFFVGIQLWRDAVVSRYALMNQLRRVDGQATVRGQFSHGLDMVCMVVSDQHRIKIPQ